MDIMEICWYSAMINLTVQCCVFNFTFRYEMIYNERDVILLLKHACAES